MSSCYPIILLVLVGIAAGCDPGTMGPPPPSDPCFEGDYSNEFFSLHVSHHYGLIIFFVSKDATEHNPWEGMSFVGSVVRPGRAEGTSRLMFPDGHDSLLEHYVISLAGTSDDCSARNTLRLDGQHYDYDGVGYLLQYTLTRT